MKDITKHFTLLEIGADAESPMIGTITSVNNNSLGLSFFKNRIKTALQNHFDYTDIKLPNELPDMFAGTPYEDFVIEIEGIPYTIRILETWTY